jgi:hypothetical protein
MGAYLCAGFTSAQTCPAAPGPTGGISIVSPEANASFVSGQAVPITVTAVDFSATEIVAHWIYGSAWSASESVSLTTPTTVPVAEEIVTIQVAALDALGDSRQASVNVRVQRDSDGDTTPDVADNCPHFASVNVRDSNADGIGDACQCGDLDGPGWSGNGRVDVRDLVAVNACIFSASCDGDPQVPGRQAPTPHADANKDGRIDVSDLIALNAAIFGACMPVCTAYPVPPAGGPLACGSARSSAFPGN